MPRKEKSLIERIRRSAGKAQGSVHLGIGDDAAVLRVSPGHEILVTTDFSLEGVHFRRDWHSPDSVGHRCLARGLSDIAAMGGTPLAAFLSLALPVKMPQSWVDGFVRGLLTLAKEHGVTLAGGDTAQSPGRPSEARILADIVVVGSVPLGQAVRRSGAKPGDAIYVTGELGGSAVALDRMYAQPKRKLSAIKFPRHFYPEPRLRVGRLLRERGLITAMIDLSDGLSTDLDHLCRESRVSAQVSPEMIPRSKGATLMQVLHGGEDYELLFTVPAGHRVPRTVTGIALTRIGEIRPRQQGPLLVELLGATGKMRGLRPQGWEHLSG